MGSNSFVPTAASRRRSFNLPGFRRSSAAERQEVLKNADGIGKSSVDEAVRIQKAAAWQWYTRGVGEAALLAPTKPPVVKNPQVAPPTAAAASCGKADGISCNRNMIPIPEKTLQPPPAEVHRAAAPSRFKAEAAAYVSSPAPKPAASAGAPHAAPLGDPSTPLYDELELSSFRTHLADLVQRMRQHHLTADNEQSHLPAAAAAGDDGKSKPPPPPSVTTIDHHKIKSPPAIAVAAFSEHKPTMLPSSPALVATTLPFRTKPFSALQKLFRKVLVGSVPKCTRNSSQSIASTPTPRAHYPAEALSDDAESATSEYHHHHYIHHHHHHYHFSETPEERSSIIHRRRRHSESASSRPWAPASLEEGAGSDDEEEEDVDEAEEESRIAAYLARRRRRHSDNFSKHQLQPETADFEKDEERKEPTLPMQFPRQYNSERLLTGRIPPMVDEEFAQHVAEVEFDREGRTFEGIRCRRRRSADFHREEPCLEWTGGKSDQGGAYKLGGRGGAGGRMRALLTMAGRRHSESSNERPEATAKLAPSPDGRYWKSPSARYYADVQERHVPLPPPSAASDATTAKFNVALPPVYPQ